jgi:hypothetical protein
MDSEENYDFIKEKPDYNPWYYYYLYELIKKKKPCLPGEYIHVHNWQGCYKVYYVNAYKFTIKKNGKFVSLGWHCFKCLKGQGTSPEAIIKKTEKTAKVIIEILKKINI